MYVLYTVAVGGDITEAAYLSLPTFRLRENPPSLFSDQGKIPPL
jgi:hypothetical protein